MPPKATGLRAPRESGGLTTEIHVYHDVVSAEQRTEYEVLQKGTGRAGRFLEELPRIRCGPEPSSGGGGWDGHSWQLGDCEHSQEA